MTDLLSRGKLARQGDSPQPQQSIAVDSLPQKRRSGVEHAHTFIMDAVDRFDHKTPPTMSVNFYKQVADRH